MHGNLELYKIPPPNKDPRFPSPSLLHIHTHKKVNETDGNVNTFLLKQSKNIFKPMVKTKLFKMNKITLSNSISDRNTKQNKIGEESYS